MDNMSQSEIDDLLAGATSSAVDSPPPASFHIPAAPAQKKYRLYDFRRPDKLSKDHLRSLRAHFGRFTRSVANYLAALTRTSVDAKLVEVDQTHYGQLFRSHGIPTLFCVFRIGENVPGILKLNLSQLYAALDRIMGGPGSGALFARPLTDFERGLMGDMCRQLLVLWVQEIRSDLEVTVEMLDSDERMLPRSLANDEFMLRALYDLRLGPSSGQLSVFIPMKELNALLGTARQAETDRLASRETNKISDHLIQLPIPVTVDLGTAWVNARELSELKPGDILPLLQEEGEPMLINVGGIPRFLGRAGTLGRKLAVKVEGRAKEAR